MSLGAVSSDALGAAAGRPAELDSVADRKIALAAAAAGLHAWRSTPWSSA